MRSASWKGMALFGLRALAFPSMQQGALPSLEDLSPEQLEQFNSLIDQLDLDSVKPREVQTRSWDPEYQLVDVHGEHEWRAPGPKDLRGPCPGLNAMANHGYTPRDGISNPLESAIASQKVFGMSFELAFYLSVYSAVFSGDLVKFSIGGAPPANGLLNTLPLLGKPQGLSHSHNNFEMDGSPTRKDMYAYDNPTHNAWDLAMDRWERLMSKPLGPNGVDISVLIPFRVENLRDSVKNNPYFWQGPYTKLALEPATYFFTYRFYGNWSADAEDGYLSRENYASFLGISGEPGNWKYEPGHERVPENFYKRRVDYDIPEFAAESIKAFLEYPEMIKFGGNLGKPNTFTGIDVGELTGGVYNAENLLQGNNAMCFALQAASEVYPDLLKGLVSNIAAPLTKVLGAVGKLTAKLSCPELKEYNTDLFEKYPGAKGSY